MPNKIIETRLGIFNYEEYPLISFEAKKIETAPSKLEIDDFLEKLDKILSITNGDYVFFLDARYAKWVSSEIREYFAIRIEILASKYINRSKGNYIYVPNILIFLLMKLLMSFVTPDVLVRISFNYKKLKDLALNNFQESVKS